MVTLVWQYIGVRWNLPDVFWHMYKNATANTAIERAAKNLPSPAVQQEQGENVLPPCQGEVPASWKSPPSLWIYMNLKGLIISLLTSNFVSKTKTHVCPAKRSSIEDLVLNWGLGPEWRGPNSWNGPHLILTILRFCVKLRKSQYLGNSTSDHRERGTPQNLGIFTSETTFGHTKVVFGHCYVWNVR